MTQISQTNRIQNQNENGNGTKMALDGYSVTKLVQVVGTIHLK